MLGASATTGRPDAPLVQLSHCSSTSTGPFRGHRSDLRFGSKADIVIKSRCPLYPQKRTFAERIGMSVSASSTAACPRTQAFLTRLSTQLCQTYRDETRDHRSNDDQQSSPHIVISFLLPESPRFNFITQPTKRCLPLQFISEAVAAERFAEFFHAAAFELSAPGGFHFRFGHPRSLIPS